MVDQNQIPSLNPVNNDSLIGVFTHVMKKYLQGQINDMLPCQVVSVSSDRRFVSVQPLIMVVGTSGTNFTRAPVAKIPVHTLGAGGWVISFPIQPGDLGWMKSNDRDISLFLKSLKLSPPNTYRLHQFEDAVYMPTVLAAYTINSADASSMIISSLDGGVRIAFSPTQITMTAPNVVINSNLIVNGDINATGDILAGTISLKTHVHSGVQPGSGNTGEPV